jgi:glycosyltransferase involved in cell wall biosynthesis
VEFKATVGPDEVPALLRGARAVLSPSVSHEGAGRVVLEAYAARVPVIVSHAGGLPEAVEEGMTGLLLPAMDISGWRQSVERLEDDSESERMGKAAWEPWAESYTPRKALAGIEDCYRKAVA